MAENSNPDRPQSAYLLWLQENKETLRNEHPNLNNVEIAKLGGEIWRKLKDKSKWEKLAKERRREFLKGLRESEETETTSKMRKKDVIVLAKQSSPKCKLCSRPLKGKSKCVCKPERVQAAENKLKVLNETNKDRRGFINAQQDAPAKQPQKYLPRWSRPYRSVEPFHYPQSYDPFAPSTSNFVQGSCNSTHNSNVFSNFENPMMSPLFNRNDHSTNFVQQTDETTDVEIPYCSASFQSPAHATFHDSLANNHQIEESSNGFDHRSSYFSNFNIPGPSGINVPQETENATQRRGDFKQKSRHRSRTSHTIVSPTTEMSENRNWISNILSPNLNQTDETKINANLLAYSKELVKSVYSIDHQNPVVEISPEIQSQSNFSDDPSNILQQTNDSTQSENRFEGSLIDINGTGTTNDADKVDNKTKKSKKKCKEKSVEKSKKQKSTKLECPVCFKSTISRNPTMTNCGHVYCRDCITSSVSLFKKCPVCLKEISLNDIFPMYI